MHTPSKPVRKTRIRRNANFTPAENEKQVLFFNFAKSMPM